jgi:hypothetical protein
MDPNELDKERIIEELAAEAEGMILDATVKSVRKTRKRYKKRVRAMKAELAVIKARAEAEHPWLTDAGEPKPKAGSPQWYNRPAEYTEDGDRKHFIDQSDPRFDPNAKQPVPPEYKKGVDALTRSVARLIAAVASHADRIETVKRYAEKMIRDVEKRRAALGPVAKSEYSGFDFPDADWRAWADLTGSARLRNKVDDLRQRGII